MKRRRYALCATLWLTAAGLSAPGAWASDGAGADAPPAADVSSSAPEASAATGTKPSDAERARYYYELGAEAFAAQRNADAIRYFRLAADIVPSSKLRYNIALAYEEMGDTGRALAEYRAYLRQEQSSEQLAEVLGRVHQLEARLATLGVQQLSVLSSPPGATVRIGEQPVGVTPWSGELAPGLHEVTLELSGYAGQRSEVALPAHESAELRLELSPRPAEQPPKPEPAAWGRIEPLTWTFLGVGLGALSGGLAFELSRATSSDRAGRASSSVDAAEARGAADAKQMASLTLLGFGSAFLIGGGVLLALDLADGPLAAAEAASAARSRFDASLGLPCVPGFCGVAARGRF